MRKALYIFVVLVSLLTQIQAQPYDLSAGIKAGYSSGLVLRYFNDFHSAFDAQALYNPKGFQFSLGYIYHDSPYSKKRLYYYGGAGIHMGNWLDERAAGVFGFTGIEYVFRDVPLSAGIEWKPMINVWEQFDYVWYDISIHLRVIIK